DSSHPTTRRSATSGDRRRAASPATTIAYSASRNVKLLPAAAYGTQINCSISTHPTTRRVSIRDMRFAAGAQRRDRRARQAAGARETAGPAAGSVLGRYRAGASVRLRELLPLLRLARAQPDRQADVS